MGLVCGCHSGDSAGDKISAPSCRWALQVLVRWGIGSRSTSLLATRLYYEAFVVRVLVERSQFLLEVPLLGVDNDLLMFQIVLSCWHRAGRSDKQLFVDGVRG